MWRRIDVESTSSGTKCPLSYDFPTALGKWIFACDLGVQRLIERYFNQIEPLLGRWFPLGAQILANLCLTIQST